MRFDYITAVLALASITAAAPATQAAQAVNSSSSAAVTFSNSKRFFFDTDGNALDSTSGKIDIINGQYMWVGVTSGTGKTDNQGIKTYSSTDLTQWQDNGFVFNYSAPENLAVCGQLGGCGRPKILYNELTKKYVLYMFSGMPGLVVFTSDERTKGYTYAGRSLQAYQPDGYQSWDHSLAILDGKGYLIHGSWSLATTMRSPTSIWPPFLQTVFIEPLTPDYLNGTGSFWPVTLPGAFPVTQNSSSIIDGSIEAPDLFKRGDTYYVVGSMICSFCNSTGTLAYRSKSLQGPWTRQLISDTTCGGQAMGVATIPGVNGAEPTYLYHADLFSLSPAGFSSTAAHGHGFWPLQFNADGSIQDIDCSPSKSFQINVPKLPVSVSIGGRATSATVGSGETGSYLPEAGIPEATYYQTWQSSKSGNLTEVGVNIATLFPSANLTLTVFRFKGRDEILRPFFAWETLSTIKVGLNTPVSQAFAVVKIPVGKPIRFGEFLGISVGVGLREGARAGTRYAVLTREASNRRHRLYALARGAVSYIGNGYDISPVKWLNQQELKWYARVE